MDDLYPYIAAVMVQPLQSSIIESYSSILSLMKGKSKYGVLLPIPGGTGRCKKCSQLKTTMLYVTLVKIIKPPIIPTGECARCLFEPKWNELSQLDQYASYVIDDITSNEKEPTHILQVFTNTIKIEFQKRLKLLTLNEMRQLVQFMCIFGNHKTIELNFFIQLMKPYCKKLGLTKFNGIKKQYNTWWAKHYYNNIVNGKDYIRHILFIQEEGETRNIYEMPMGVEFRLGCIKIPVLENSYDDEPLEDDVYIQYNEHDDHSDDEYYDIIELEAQ